MLLRVCLHGTRGRTPCDTHFLTSVRNYAHANTWSHILWPRHLTLVRTIPYTHANTYAASGPISHLDMKPHPRKHVVTHPTTPISHRPWYIRYHIPTQTRTAASDPHSHLGMKIHPRKHALQHRGHTSLCGCLEGGPTLSWTSPAISRSPLSSTNFSSADYIRSGA